MGEDGPRPDDVIDAQFQVEPLPDARLASLRGQVRPENVVIVARDVVREVPVDRVVYRERPAPERVVYRERPAASPPAPQWRERERMSEGAARVYVAIAVLAALLFLVIFVGGLMQASQH